MLSELGQPVLSPPPGQGAEHRARRPGEALLGAVEWLVARQDPGGWWVGELETNVTMTAEHVLLLRFLGVDPTPVRDGAIRHLLREQREDGSWALYYDGPADLSTTIEAYAARYDVPIVIRPTRGRSPY